MKPERISVLSGFSFFCFNKSRRYIILFPYTVKEANAPLQPTLLFLNRNTLFKKGDTVAQYSRKLKKGFRWFYKFDYDCKMYSSKCIFLSQKDAKKAETKRYDEVSKSISNPDKKPSMSLLTLIESRLDYLKVKKSENYYKATKSYFKLLLTELGKDCLIAAISKQHINTFLLARSEEYQKRGRDNYRVNAMLRAYKALFNYGIQQLDLHLTNPCIGLGLYSIKKKLKYIPTDKEIQQVLDMCDEEEKVLIEFVQETGCRISEAMRFTDTDINGENIVLYTRKSKNSDLTPRVVPAPKVLDKLMPLKKNCKIFGRWKTHPKFLEDKIKKLKQPRRWNWHNLRHRYASILSKQGRPLFEIMMLLGHNNLSTTQKYLQLLG